MKPLTSDEFEELSDLGNENRFQKVRMQEVLAFWESGADAAEMRTAGDVTIARERELYKKALRQLRIHGYGIDFTQRKGKLYAFKKTMRDSKRGECIRCGGRLSEFREHDGRRYRHCFSCHFEFYES